MLLWSHVVWSRTGAKSYIPATRPQRGGGAFLSGPWFFFLPLFFPFSFPSSSCSSPLSNSLGRTQEAIAYRWTANTQSREQTERDRERQGETETASKQLSVPSSQWLGAQATKELRQLHALLEFLRFSGFVWQVELGVLGWQGCHK